MITSSKPSTIIPAPPLSHADNTKKRSDLPKHIHVKGVNTENSKVKTPSLLNKMVTVIKEISHKIMQIISRICAFVCCCSLSAKEAADNKNKDIPLKTFTCDAPPTTTPPGKAIDKKPAPAAQPKIVDLSKPQTSPATTTTELPPPSTPTAPTFAPPPAPSIIPSTPVITETFEDQVALQVKAVKRKYCSLDYSFSADDAAQKASSILELFNTQYSITTSPSGNKQLHFTFPNASKLVAAKNAIDKVMEYNNTWGSWQFDQDAITMTLSSMQTYLLLGFPNLTQQVWNQRFANLMEKLEADLADSKTPILGLPVREMASSTSPVLTKEPVATHIAHVAFKSPIERLKDMESFYDVYYSGYAPTANRKCLTNYIQSKDFERHAASAKVYYNSQQLSLQDSVRVTFQREPVNIEMHQRYDKTKLENFLTNQGFTPHTEGVFNDTTSKRADGSTFKDQPCSACIYSETFLWSKVGDDSSKKEIGCLSVPAPALDVNNQPHYAYYIKDGALDLDKYKQEMQVLANAVVNASLDNKTSAFQGKGLKRVVISLYGQNNFLKAAKDSDRKAANQLFYSTLVTAIQNHASQLQDLEIVLSDYGNLKNPEFETSFVAPLKAGGLKVGYINGNILLNAKEGDLIVNSWDPHSIPGNGNELDNSFDGVLGRATGITLTQCAWINPHISQKSDGMPVDASKYIAITQ